MKINEWFDSRKEEDGCSNGEKIMLWFVLGIVLCSFLIVIFFILQLRKEFTVCTDQPINGQITGQVGDFIGGVAGSLWAFAGVLLFYIALRLQRRELNFKGLSIAVKRMNLY